MAVGITATSVLTRDYALALELIQQRYGSILPAGFEPCYDKLEPKRACRCTNCGAQGWAGHKCEYCGRPV